MRCQALSQKFVIGGLHWGAENAGLENAAPDCRGGKRGSSTVWKAKVSVI